MRNLIVLGAAALTLALGVAQASASPTASDHSPARLEVTTPSAATDAAPYIAGRFEAHEFDASQAPAVRRMGR